VAYIEKLSRLKSLFLGLNRINDIWEIDKLASLSFLIELSLINNPISRKNFSRSAILKRIPTLKILDGIVWFSFLNSLGGERR
jgi:Leucine-rich repeat (LRR) protein